jgi:hypothetical protein
LHQLYYGYITLRRYGQYKDADPLAATCNAGVVVRAVDDEGHESNYYGVIEDILKLTFGGDKDLRVVFYCDWFDPTHGTRQNKYGMVEIKHENGYVVTTTLYLRSNVNRFII